MIPHRVFQEQLQLKKLQLNILNKALQEKINQFLFQLSQQRDKILLTEEVEKTEKRVRTLKPVDRCDSCGAEAFVWVNGVSGDLLFCAHHFNKWEDKIREFAFEVIDERDFINAKPEGSAY